MSPRETRFERLAYWWALIAVAVGIILGLEEVWRTSGPEGLTTLGSYALTSLLLLGKFVVFLGLREDSPLGPWGLALLVWTFDLVFSLALLSGLEGLEHTPVLGRWMRRARRRAMRVLSEYPGLGRMAFLGVVAFVMMPLAATGAVSGSFAARLVGMSRIAGVLAIAAGSAGTAFGFAFLAVALGERAEQLARSPLVTGASIVFLVALGRLAYVRVTARLRVE